MATTTTPEKAQLAEPLLAMSFELGASQWKMAFSPGLGQRPRIRPVRAGDLATVEKEIAAAKARFGLPEQTRVLSCYEAGREGFWLHRALEAMGVQNVVVDSSSIEVDRRARRAKTDRLDGEKLVGMLLRWAYGEARVWKVVRVPTPEEEDRRHLHRELKTAQRDRTRVTNRIRSLLYTQGMQLSTLKELPQQLDSLQLWNGQPLPEGLRRRLEREWGQVVLLKERIRELEAQRRQQLSMAQEAGENEEADAGRQCAQKLLRLAGIGPTAAWLFSRELFWREVKNRRQLGALAGLTPTPYQSGTDQREQGIAKAGNRWVRAVAIEIAWGWLRYQPQSELSRWYQERFGGGSTRQRKIGIVALARKLLIALWKYLQTGTPPAGAVLKA